ncbi:MAG: epoxyqueuosine reductase [Clostridia bacterium]|nr:epoxyqueuosine reductase [Clostridia bacterium]
MFPYFVREGKNLSCYATSEDYHLFAGQFGAELETFLLGLYPSSEFRFFCDNSPLDERHAATLAGLGVMGDNGLFISHTYGSFVFIGAVLSTLPAQAWGCDSVSSVKGCLHCGECRRACPTGYLRDREQPCLSALTQKKGTLTEQELAYLKKSGSVWGCDACQMACPLNRKEGKIPQTPIDFFHKSRVEHITSAYLDTLDDASFSRRAFAWRGKNTILRNVLYLEEDHKS